jgi:peptidoglycan/LPS O-acetylase OafA/YrhL
MLFHTTILRGGFVGVDMFFVLSGFLITSILIQEHRNGGISIRRFYARRALRLMPALLAFLAALAALLLLDPRLHILRDDTLVFIPFVLLYVSNWVFTFMPASTPFPLGLVGMTWSLAIEEQYYLAWPFLLRQMIRRWSDRTVATVLLCAAAAEVMLRFFAQLSGETAWRPMTMTFTDSDGLLIGSALAMLYAAGAFRLVPSAVRAIGAAVLAMTLFLAPGNGPWNGIGILIGELATAALICSALSSKGHRVLESRPLRWIGERSYAMYLWHLTVIHVLAMYITAGRFRMIYIALLTFVITFVLADLSYRFVEQPFLRRKARLNLPEREPAIAVVAT